MRPRVDDVRRERAILAAIHCWAENGDPRLTVDALPAAPRCRLRASTVGCDGPPGDGPARVVRIDPADGATGVFLDDPVVATLSHPADVRSATLDTFRVANDAGLVAGRLHLSPDARVVVFIPERRLHADVEHVVTIAGLRDRHGREMAPHASRFVPCPFTTGDVMN